MMEKERDFSAIDVSQVLEELPGLQVWGHHGEEEEEERWILPPCAAGSILFPGHLPKFGKTWLGSVQRRGCTWWF